MHDTTRPTGTVAPAAVRADPLPQTVAGPPAPERQAAASTAVPSATGETTTTGRRSFVRLLRMAGPAFVVGCWGFGPGNLTTSIQAGSGFGYQLVWVVVAATILMLTLTDMSVRIGIKSPVSLLTAVKQRLGTWVGYLAGCAVFVITLMFSVGNAVGSGLALSMLFGGAPVFWSVVCTLAVAVVLVLRNVYGVMERVMIVAMALMALAFVLSAVLARPDWWLAVEGLVPRVPEGSTTIVIALIGTCLSANAAFYSAYGTRERRRTESQYRDITVADTVPGIVAPGVMTALVILVAAKVFDGPGEIASTIGQLSSVFEPLAGSVGTWVFSLGFFAAAFSAMTANATAGGTMLSDALGKGASASTTAARIFSGVILTVGLVVTAIFQASPVQLIVIAQSLTVLTAPVLCFLLVYMATKAEFMGRLRNRWWQVALGAVAFAVLGVFWVQLVIGLVS
ncbi:MAG TPA: manganese transporter [Micrococcales bacterium]|uniref:Nramp family divalent metal transporter n=1 Tax=Miniimonas TaxID=947525 RepID=UPI000D526E91|nr:MULTISPECIES: Nramp family divalent metal transporter [Miniimonas]HCX83821.1 manganese transporter [Micrococcales bacterium]